MWYCRSHEEGGAPIRSEFFSTGKLTFFISQDASEAERSDSDTVQDKDENDSYSDDFEDEEKSTSAADATSIYSYASLVHAEHAEK